jgi:2,4-dienoyl-CoA reductase-like NADH-dependent reductase (Old Yellow Enzyme family)
MAAMTTDLFAPLPLKSGAVLKNRFVLAPLTNLQSPDNGLLSEDEFNWLTKRAKGGFGLTMTCAASVQHEGIGFPGQLGLHDDKHVPGLTRLAGAIKAHGSFAVAQLHHGGMRALPAVIGRSPQAPSDDEKTGAVAMSGDEIKRAIDAFVAAARRVERAGFDGAELHGAHGYLICQFLSPETNRRDDAYGGDAERRARFLFETLDAVKAVTSAAFSVGVRLSPERFGLKLDEIVAVAARLMREEQVDYIDMSLWDAFKQPNDEAFQGKSLAAYFAELPRGAVRLGPAGKIYSAADVRAAMALGFDFVVIGRGAIVHHDFPRRFANDADFAMAALPVSADHLRAEGLGEPFVNYMRTWKGFVADEAA